MADLPLDQELTIDQLETLFQTFTVGATGLADAQVRIGWPQQGAPGWEISDDMVALRVYEVQDPAVDRQREIQFFDLDDDKTFTKLQMSYMRVMEVDWTIYGPDAYETASAIRDHIYYPDALYLLDKNNLGHIPGIHNIVRLREQFQGSWWERCELIMRFNEEIIRYAKVPYLTSAEAFIETAKGLALDINIS